MYYGIANYVGILANLTEVLTYCFVVVMLVPLTKLQLERRKEVKNVLLQGFLSVDELKEAVLVANPEMDSFEKETVNGLFGRYKEILNRPSSMSLTSSLVERPDFNYGAYNFEFRRTIISTFSSLPPSNSHQSGPALIDTIDSKITL